MSKRTIMTRRRMTRSWMPKRRKVNYTKDKDGGKG